MSETTYSSAGRSVSNRAREINDARVLLQNHRVLLRRKAVIMAKLRKCMENPDCRIDDKIEEMVFGGRQLDGMPKAKGYASATERIALIYRDQLQEEDHQEIVALIAELRSIETNLDIYDAMIKSLTEAEANLIRWHYDEGKSFTRIVQSDELTAALGIYSVSTLKRLHQKILEKIDCALG